jgi:hypothetical protein
LIGEDSDEVEAIIANGQHLDSYYKWFATQGHCLKGKIYSIPISIIDSHKRELKLISELKIICLKPQIDLFTSVEITQGEIKQQSLLVTQSIICDYLNLTQMIITSKSYPHPCFTGDLFLNSLGKCLISFNSTTL